MLGSRSAAAALAVKDLARARAFYEGTLGLEVADDATPGVLVLKSGASRLVVYESAFAGTNRATAAMWGVGGDLDGIVRALRAAGVAFEHYDDMPHTRREGDVHVSGGMRVAWFKDPDGNILSLINT